MRPRHYTAENKDGDLSEASCYDASMRPRHYTAENFDQVVLLRHFLAASMRPRHYTAENRDATVVDAARLEGFNEAAALHRGKRGG